MTATAFGYTDHGTYIVNIDGRHYTEIEITDEQHPLYGRKFKVSTDQSNISRPKSIRVIYKEKIQTLIPISSTNLNNNPKPPFSKLTPGSVKDTILLLQEVEACIAKNKKSGRKSQAKRRKKS